MICPFCQRENASGVLVCDGCARDIAVPTSLVAERDELLRKREILRHELSAAMAEFERLRLGKKRRLF
jgi:hypothetical protein